MKRTSLPPALGYDPELRRDTWVQTERKSHEAWAQLIAKKPTAGGLLHVLVWQMGEQNAVVVPQKILAELMGVSVRTISTAIGDLVYGHWIQVVRIGKGKECAYVINDKVAWSDKRDKLPLSLFSATIVADKRDQDEDPSPQIPLRRIPALYPMERQLPSGPGEDPPSQPALEGLEPDLPATRQKLERIDPKTGEITS